MYEDFERRSVLAHDGPAVRRHPRVATLVAGASLITATVVNPAAALGVASDDASPPAVHQLPAAGQTLVANLHGTKAGDADGTGYATFKLYKKKGKVCATVTWSKIGTPSAAHIHRGKAGQVGPVRVDLSGSVTGGAKCATGVSHKLIGRILTYPRRYYFNVHNVDYPDGAIRGQLHR